MTEAKTYIYRITHYRNAGFILRNGLYCCNYNGVHDPDFVSIGHQSLIDNRGQSEVKIPPGGVLNDYIPFYFHYKMPMLYHLYKRKVKEYQGSQEDIIYLISSIEKVQELGLPFLFTDRHAYLKHKRVFNNTEHLDQLSWHIIKEDTWHQEYSALRKELKQAEFLIHQMVPVKAILGFVAHNEEIATFVRKQIQMLGLDLQVAVRTKYYYP